MLSPVSFAAPVFRGVKIKNDKKTDDAINKLAPVTRPVVKSKLEAFESDMNARVEDRIDLSVGLEYVKKPFPYADILSINLYDDSGKKPLVTSVPCYISSCAPAYNEAEILKGLKESGQLVLEMLDDANKKKEDEVFEELTNFENDFAVFGRNKDAKRKIANSIVALNDTDILCSIATFPSCLKTAGKQSPNLCDKKYAVEFEYLKDDEDNALAVVSLVDMDKYADGSENPCVLEIAEINEACEKPKTAAIKALLRAQREFDTFFRNDIKKES